MSCKHCNCCHLFIFAFARKIINNFPYSCNRKMCGSQSAHGQQFPSLISGIALCKDAPKQYLKVGHHVGLELDPLWSHFSSIFFFQCSIQYYNLEHWKCYSCRVQWRLCFWQDVRHLWGQIFDLPSPADTSWNLSQQYSMCLNYKALQEIASHVQKSLLNVAVASHFKSLLISVSHRK